MSTKEIEPTQADRDLFMLLIPYCHQQMTAPSEYAWKARCKGEELIAAHRIAAERAIKDSLTTPTVAKKETVGDLDTAKLLAAIAKDEAEIAELKAEIERKDAALLAELEEMRKLAIERDKFADVLCELDLLLREVTPERRDAYGVCETEMPKRVEALLMKVKHLEAERDSLLKAGEARKGQP